MEWLVTVGVALGLALTSWHGVQTRNWKPFASALVAGFIGLIAGFCVLVFAESATPEYTLMAGGGLLIASVVWWRVHESSWEWTWDRLMSFVGSLQMGISIFIVIVA